MKKLWKMTNDKYEVIVKDYGYKSRLPVAVRISGKTLGESINAFGEPCYYYYSQDAYSMNEGIALAKHILYVKTGIKY